MSEAQSSLRRRVFSVLSARLTDAGYEEREDGIFTKTISDRPFVLGWVGLNTARQKRGGTLDVNPVVGVRHQEVEQRVAELRGATSHDYLPPTISVQLGYVEPAQKYRPWRFRDDVEVEPTASTLMEALQRFGEKFMARHTELDRLAEAIEEFGFVPSRSYRLPVVLAMLDHHDAARDVLLRDLPLLGDTPNDARRAYEEFVDTMLDEIGSPQ